MHGLFVSKLFYVLVQHPHLEDIQILCLSKNNSKIERLPESLINVA